MASTAEAVTTELPQDLDSKLDRLFSPQEEAPQQETPEAVAEEPGEEVETPAETSETTEEVPEFKEVEFNGQKYQVPPEMVDALMKSSDYTQKTQSLAQQRREMELQQKEIAVHREEAAFTQSVSQELDTLKMLEQYIPYLKANTNWDQLTTDQFVRKQKEIQDLADQHRDLIAQLHGKHQEFVKQVEGKRANLKKEMSEVLTKAIPGWADTHKSEAEAYVKTLGYPEVAIPHMSSLDYQVAWKASQYDKLKSNTAASVKKAGDAPMIKATSRKEMPSAVKEMLNTKKVLKTAKPGSPELKAALDKRLSQIFG